MVYGRRRVPRSKRLAQLKRETFILRAGLITLILLLLLFGLTFLSRIESFRIKDINIEGNSVTSGRDIEKIIKNNIAGYYFKMFDRENFLLYPKDQITKDLMNEFQRIKEVDLSIKDLSLLQVIIEEREPDILWCGVERSVEVEECYFMDSDGLIYSKAPNFSGNVFLRAYGKIGGSVPIGREFLPVSRYQSLKFLKGAIEQNGLTPSIVFKLPSNDDMEIWFEEGGRFIYNLDQDVVRLSEDLGSILRDKEFKEGLNDGNIELDYIDLRLGNKVYYRFK